MRKLALKRLTASDLTLFEWHFRNFPAGNQKAINLNSEVFIQRLYPSLPEIAVDLGGRLPIDVSIFGPGLAGLDNRQRKIVKHGSYKNWRLDGEFIADQPQSPGRYNGLQAGDLVLFEFYGLPVPTAAKLIFLSRSVTDDTALFAAFDGILGGRGMMEISPPQIHAAVEAASPASAHPVRELVLESAIEDALLGGGRAIAHPNRRFSREDLQRTRKNLDEIGRRGEELVARYLAELQVNAEIDEFSWTADYNAVAPYDFEITSNGVSARIDVKTTAGEFGRALHISNAELAVMSDASVRYDLFRVFDLDGEGASLRIAEDMGGFSRSVFQGLQGLPPAVKIDGISVLPTALRFGEPIHVSFNDEGESEE